MLQTEHISARRGRSRPRLRPRLDRAKKLEWPSVGCPLWTREGGRKERNPFVRTREANRSAELSWLRNLRVPSPPILLTGAAATFLVVQFIQIASAYRPISGSVSLLSYGGPTLLESSNRFAAVSLAGLLIARRGQRVLFPLPCLALMLTPALFWAMREASPTAIPIGLSWTSPWLGVVVDGLLALTPAAVVAVGSSSQRARPTAQGFGAIGACAAVSGIIVWVRWPAPYT